MKHMENTNLSLPANVFFSRYDSIKRTKTIQVLSALLDESRPFNTLTEIAKRVIQRYGERGDVKWFHAVTSSLAGVLSQLVRVVYKDGKDVFMSS